MAKAINEQVPFTEKKMKTTLKALEPTEISETNTQNDKEEEDLMMKETFTIDNHYTGLIIGKSGTMIKKKSLRNPTLKSESLMLKYVVIK